ncbi:ParB-like protein [Novosphingobium sp. Rr 2-17]|uniref:ParB/RepB/Spo0J family partition protein n=1 Tax=Novosphingobium sp. Rr 2-17 TaxID=555793 RepID=UPI0002699F0A|nr:ParB N-terminal domain-containing protein [Novosphingobium sp. Rr 2-17]EIZ77993.1 ParB-like protein [Novosphingobium sp. Rr 2-17]
MELAFIALDKLSISKANMRYARKAPDVSDILPTVRARGIIQPILVRPLAGAGCAGEAPSSRDGQYEIVAGCRRFHAAKLVAAERRAAHADRGEPDPEAAAMPCAILEDADDAAAVEASLIENVARLDPDEVARWECFIRLVKQGRSLDQIAQTFGLTDLAVKRILALGNLLPRIRDMYRRDQIDAATVRHLTLASKHQQKAWLALYDDPEAYVPRGFQLKSWLFAGPSVLVRHAVFEVADSGLAVVTDLFGNDPFFADSEAFWLLQNAAIAAKQASFVEAGWADAVVLGPDCHFHAWEYEKVAKRQGGRVYLDVHGNGEVVVHEGYLSRTQAARLGRSTAADGTDVAAIQPVRPELTAITQTYLDLHRHAAVRAALLDRPAIALRLMVAHALAGSALWRVAPEPQTVRSDSIKTSLDACRGEAVFAERRRAVLALLQLPEDDPFLVRGSGYGIAGVGLAGEGRALCPLFARLVELSDAQVMDVLTLVMGETLAAGSPAIDAVAPHIGVAMADWWQADDAFLETLRDREVLLAMVAEVAGPPVAAANAREKCKTLKGIIRDHLAGTGGRTQCEGWVPRWMAFPPSAYTARGGVATVAAHARATARCEPEAEDLADASGPDCDAERERAAGHEPSKERREAIDPDHDRGTAREPGGESSPAAAAAAPALAA